MQPPLWIELLLLLTDTIIKYFYKKNNSFSNEEVWLQIYFLTFLLGVIYIYFIEGDFFLGDNLFFQ